ncbi:sister chromatid cohesion 1 protein 3-like isoform X2 [Phoenix dactylifera]|uniref:Sister chromatid cohesion 1 protein 3-like isoform X2 n=1 Tax=Phoenix dactylifera TaxID=42345 RepID=A0A8B9ASK8_PHODC|nr:sister chromatid cohesion 1 protein 3-like isoform X2 [Phoenix dactylifera]
MFYSHTFLARKSPLGTVWIAAHLERRIKKPQIDVIDIPSYAEFIMFPEVPIALRLSGHLLLGLVRIYSWKVNYLFQDCNRMLTDIRMAFASIQVNLPAEADRAPFESVTLPETFELDALELDDSIYQTDLDDHRKTYEEITMTDETPGGREQYIRFFINEDDRTDSSTQLEMPTPGAGPMEEDVLPPFEGGFEAILTPDVNAGGARDPGPSNQTEGSFQSFNESHFVQEFPDIETMRKAERNFEPGNIPELDDTDNDIGGLLEGSVPMMNRNLSPILEHVLVSGGEFLPSPSRAKAPTVASADDLDIQNMGLSLGQPLPDLELQPSPPVNGQKAKKRKKKQYFDESLVLTNVDMKRQLEDTNKLVCKRRKLPCSALDTWRLRRTLRNEHIFHEPLLSGICTDLQEAFEKILPQKFPHADSAPMDASPGLMHPSSPVARPDTDMEPERPRFGSPTGGNLPDRVPSPSEREEMTPFDTGNVGSVSDAGRTFETEVLPTFEIPALSEPASSQPETSFFRLEEEWVLNDTNPPEIPGLLDSADGQDLNFLEASNVSSGYRTTEVENMSARTRAVAQYLKERSPSTKSSIDGSGNVSLNEILEGKTRKQCARMFFETMVLKSYGLIDVQQEEAYADILISPTPALSTAKF